MDTNLKIGYNKRILPFSYQFNESALMVIELDGIKLSFLKKKSAFPDFGISFNGPKKATVNTIRNNNVRLAFRALATFVLSPAVFNDTFEFEYTLAMIGTYNLSVQYIYGNMSKLLEFTYIVSGTRTTITTKDTKVTINPKTTEQATNITTVQNSEEKLSRIDPEKINSTDDLLRAFSFLKISDIKFEKLSVKLTVLLLKTYKGDMTPCLINCTNNGACVVNANDKLVCDCDEFFIGEDCRTDIRPCSTKKCQNNGTCFNNLTNVPPSFRCECPRTENNRLRFTGEYCENKINVCKNTTCSSKGKLKNYLRFLEKFSEIDHFQITKQVYALTWRVWPHVGVLTIIRVIIVSCIPMKCGECR